MPEAQRIDKRHGLHLRAVASVMAALGGTVLLCAGIALLAWRSATSTPRQLGPNAAALEETSAIALESAPRAAFADYAAEKDRLLHAREWIDASAGVARIPIDTAMQALAERDAQRRANLPPAPPPP